MVNAVPSVEQEKGRPSLLRDLDSLLYRADGCKLNPRLRGVAHAVAHPVETFHRLVKEVADMGNIGL